MQKEASKRQQQQQENSGKEEENLADERILAEEHLEKPEAPEQFNNSSVREEIFQKALQIRRRPGEPRLKIELGKVDVTPTENCPKGEQERRKDVSR